MIDWQTALQVFSTGMAGIASWFLFDFVREFKAFKVEANKEIQTLRAERSTFQSVVRNAEMSMSLRTSEITKLVSEFKILVKSDVLDLKSDLREIKALTSNHESFMRKSLEVSKRLNQEVKSLKIKMGEVLIIKNGK